MSGWFKELRVGVNGPVPTVLRTSWRHVGSDEHHYSWTVEYPDYLEWDCCGLTDFRGFDSWKSALAFALMKSWEIRNERTGL